MKTFLRNVILPAVLMAAAIGASYYAGWLREQKTGEAELQALEPGPAPVKVIRRAGMGMPNNISLADAEAEIDYLLAGNLPDGVPNLQRAVMQLISQMNPADIAALFDELPDGAIRNILLQRAGNAGWVQRWARLDTKAALEWIGTLSPDEAQGAYRTILVPILAQVGQGSYDADAKVAAQYLDKLTDPALRNQAIGILAPNMARTDPAGALAWLGQVATGDLYAKGVASIFNTLVGQELRPVVMPDGESFTMPGSTGVHDPSAAVDLLTKVDDPAMRASAIGVIADGWAKLDPAAAVNWAAMLPEADGTARTAALNTIMTDWGKNDPAAAVAYVQSSNNQAALQAAAPSLADTLSQVDPNAAMTFAQSLPAGAAKDQAINNVLVNVSVGDFSSAWNMAANLPAGTSRDAAMVSLVSEQAVWDPAQAVGLLDQFSTPAEQNSATRTLAKGWVAQDPSAASVWMQSLPTGAQHDAAAVELISAVAAKDPASALNWANSVSAPAVRADAVQWVLSGWVKTDSTAALNALQSANLTEEERTTIAQEIAQAQAKAK